MEHSYPALWKALQRCLKHRNSLLRRDRIAASYSAPEHEITGQGELAVWDAEFARLSERVNEHRQSYLARFKPVFEQVLRQLSDIPDISFGYQPGWDLERPLVDVLQDTIHRDQKARTTSYGAHRADLRVKAEGRPANDVLSRGQIKTVVCALRIAQGYFVSSADWQTMCVSAG